MNLIVMLVLMIILFVARDTPAQTQCPELPFYVLVPGTPCSCLAADGVWLSGLCRR